MDKANGDAPFIPLYGTAVPGAGLGRLAGLPAAGLRLHRGQAAPEPGVYAAEILLGGRRLCGLAHIAPGGGAPSIELLFFHGGEAPCGEAVELRLRQSLFTNSENQILDLMRTITNDEITFTKRLAKAITALRVEDWNEGTIATFIKDLSVFKETIEEYDSQIIDETSTADTYKLITTDSMGREVVKTFNRSEYSARAKLLYNEITNSIDEMGQSITEQEKRQILIEILEKLC